MLTDLSILIVEEEYLIALDIERIVHAAHGGSVVTTFSAGEALSLVDAGARFDLAITEMPREGSQAGILASRLRAAGTALVVCSADSPAPSELLPLGDMPVVAKPFAEEDLLAACAHALRHRTPVAFGC